MSQTREVPSVEPAQSDQQVMRQLWKPREAGQESTAVDNEEPRFLLDGRWGRASTKPASGCKVPKSDFTRPMHHVT